MEKSENKILGELGASAVKIGAAALFGKASERDLSKFETSLRKAQQKRLDKIPAQNHSKIVKK